jgi:hypothetical protein
MTQLSFGTGALWGERVDTTGALIGPVPFAILQGVTLNFEWTVKELYGQNQFPVALARGQAKVTGTAKSAQLLGRFYSDILFGETPTVGQFGIAQGESHAIAASVSVTNSAVWVDDLGVQLSLNGSYLVRVLSAPTVGEYTVTAGVYSFNATDVSNGGNVLISYHYTVTATGLLTTINNHPQGYTPYFRATFYQSISPNPPPQTASSVPFAYRLNACTMSKGTFDTKVDEWEIPDVSFSAFADTTGVVGYFSTVE